MIADLDLTYSHDGNRPLAMELPTNMGTDRVWDPDRYILFLDRHPSPNAVSAAAHIEPRDFARAQGGKLYEMGVGISHVVLPERDHIAPGDLVIGSDSHACTGGALAAFTTGVGSKYKIASLDPRELTRHPMEDIDPGFGQRVRPGDILAAGRNFGRGSSREGAPLVIEAAGIGTGDELDLDLEAGTGRNRSTGAVIEAAPLPRATIDIVRDGGLAAHIRKHRNFQVG